MLAESSVRLMRRLVEQEPAQLVQDFVELADCATNGPVGGANDVLRIVEMVRRQADTALEALGAVGEPYLGDLLAGRLPLHVDVATRAGRRARPSEKSSPIC